MNNVVQDRTPSTAGHATPAQFGAGNEIRIRMLGLVEYATTLSSVQEFTLQRSQATCDELWLLQHPAVYTLGIAARPQHLPRLDNGIVVIKSDRGGQITYHGPGQAVVYLMLDLQRRGTSVRPLVRLLEQAVTDLLATYGVAAHSMADAPGVYVGQAKVAALGLRIRRGCCYHGVALNVDMDLTPFGAIDPCGYAGLQVTQTRDLGIDASADMLGNKLVQHLRERLQTQ